jgi:hypothetical protein
MLVSFFAFMSQLTSFKHISQLTFPVDLFVSRLYVQLIITSVNAVWIDVRWVRYLIGGDEGRSYRGQLRK